MYNFHPFSKAITDRFNYLSKNPSELYVTATTTSATRTVEGKDELYEYYLNSFPADTNPMFRTRREYDCSTCKQFIRNIGNVVSIVDGAMVSVWDVEGLEYPYDVVAKAMSAYVKSMPIASIFRVKEGAYGAPDSKELVNDAVRTWHHFHGKILPKYQHHSPGQVIGDSDSAMQVMRRGLTELSLSAVSTVLELIASNSIYRGEEHLSALTGFKALKEEYDASSDKDLLLWSNTRHQGAWFRNTVIGTLVQDLSEGVELEKAVRSFEAKVAPANYKRPKSLITPSMIKDAVKTINELGIEPALSRRFACISDVSIRDVLFVDNEVRGQMKDGGSITSLLMSQAMGGKVPDLKGATVIGIQEFMSDVVPTASSIQVLFENSHVGNLMSMTAPVYPDAVGIFKWGNNFAWSYKNNVTDSIKQRVKAAGGNVTAPFRVSLGWFNYDDLDIHVWEPGGGSHIYFSNRRGRQGGVLDVDTNAGGPSTRTPVENVCWTYPPDGIYKIQVHNFCKRESIDVGFTLEVESLGTISMYHYPLPVTDKEYVDALSIDVKGGRVVDIRPGPKVVAGDNSKEEWGLKTQTLVRVDSIILSPNHWGDSAVGNKHWFFIMKDCLNPEPTRGIYGEYLRNDLYQKHRRVFEVLGDQTKALPTSEQLSGLGFSSTKGDKVRVLVQGRTSKTYEIQF
ncbi:hypothetical protein [Microcoleus phage My-WqHQDG]|nr:hypothetical protein [Microcoleus phage My-WqHQDG]